MGTDQIRAILMVLQAIESDHEINNAIHKDHPELMAGVSVINRFLEAILDGDVGRVCDASYELRKMLEDLSNGDADTVV